MPRWDIFDWDRARESEPKDSAPSLGRGWKDDSGTSAERPTHDRNAARERASEARTRYRDRGRTYRLRGSEGEAMSDIGKFRTVDVQDLTRFAYRGDEAHKRREIEHLRSQGLVEQKTVFRAHKTPRQMITLTEQGHQVVRRASGLPRNQKLYHGFVKAREINHDADLYAVYQQAAQEIREKGGNPVRVRLDFELKAALQRERDSAKGLSEEERVERLRAFAEEHGLTVQGTRVHVPDVQIEYETREGKLDRANLELVSENYRSQAIRDKAESGFRIYARGGDTARVRRALDDTRTVERILSV